MEYTNIIAAVPEGEHFDAAAVNEGVWMSQGHLQSIENVLAANAGRVAELEGNIQSANTEHATATEALNGQLATAQETITANQQTIEALQAVVATLKQSSAGQFTQTSKAGDDLHDKTDMVEKSETTKEAERLLKLRS